VVSVSTFSRKEREAVAEEIGADLGADLDDDLRQYTCRKCFENCINPAGSEPLDRELCVPCLASIRVAGSVKPRKAEMWYR
jgi:hypothetical protein